MDVFEARIIGRVESPLTDLAQAPRQADEGAPAAEIVGVEGCRIQVGHCEAVNGTPILDVKPQLDEDVSRR